MHRSIRWLVGTLASILGLGLLLVRWGLWASDSRLVVENTPGCTFYADCCSERASIFDLWSCCLLSTRGFCAPDTQPPNGGSGLLAISRIGLNRLVGGIAHHLQNLSGGICATPIAEIECPL